MESHLILILEQIWDLYMDPFNGSNYAKLEGYLLRNWPGYTDGNVLGSDEVIKLGLFVGKVIGTIFEMKMESHLGLVLEQS